MSTKMTAKPENATSAVAKKNQPKKTDEERQYKLSTKPVNKTEKADKTNKIDQTAKTKKTDQTAKTKKTEQTANAKKTDTTTKKQNYLQKITSALDKIGDKLVDSIGITARRESKSAENALKKAEEKRDSRQKEYDTTRDKAYADNKITDTEKGVIKVGKTLLEVANNSVTRAGEKYAEEHKDYLKTPLGKLENASEKVTSFFKSIFGNSGEDKYDTIKKQSERTQKEEEYRKKSKYIEAQTEERDGVRKTELAKLLEILKKPNTLFKKNNPLPDLKLKTEATTLDEDMALVNPKYSTNKSQYDENCAKCSLTYDLRRRGYDVTAASEMNNDGSTGLSMSEVAACYKGAKIRTMDDVLSEHKNASSMKTVAKYVKQELADCGEGARGTMCFAWQQGGGHAISWEVENGVVVFRDCQTNKKINFDEYANLSSNLNWIRTDDLTPTEEIMKYVKNR